MVKVEVVIDIPVNKVQNANEVFESKISLNILSREDANETEKSIAESIEQIFEKMLTASFDKLHESGEPFSVKTEKIKNQGA